MPPRDWSGLHDDGRADADAAVKVGDVFVQHADAAIGSARSDRTAHTLRGAVNSDLIAIEHHGGDAHGIAGRSALDQIRQSRMVLFDDGGRRPVGMKVFSLDSRRAQPFLSWLGDGDRISDRLSVIQDVIELFLTHADDDGSRVITGAEGHDIGIGPGGAHGRRKTDKARDEERGGSEALLKAHRTGTPTDMPSDDGDHAACCS